MTATGSPPQIAADARRTAHSLAIRILMTVAALATWFWTQSLVGLRGSPTAGSGDRLHVATASANLYLPHRRSVADAVLIVSSGIIDLLAIFLPGR